MRKIKLLIIALALLFTTFLSACTGVTNNESVDESGDVLCDISKFANISSQELVEILGKPDMIEKTTTNGFADFPCVYYEYNNAEELGEVDFILINNTVVKLVSYHSYPYNGGKNLLGSFNVTMGESGTKNETDTAARYRCPTNSVDDLWITNIDTSSDTFETLIVTYDMFYFEEFYIPLTSEEEVDYKTKTEINVKSILTSPKTAKFPWYDWEYAKNPFYIFVSSYVDAENAFGTMVRSDFTFIYSRLSGDIIGAVFAGEVILNNGYVDTEELVFQLIDEAKTDEALSINANNNSNEDDHSNKNESGDIPSHESDNNNTETTNRPNSSNNNIPVSTSAVGRYTSLNSDSEFSLTLYDDGRVVHRNETMDFIAYQGSWYQSGSSISFTLYFLNSDEAEYIKTTLYSDGMQFFDYYYVRQSNENTTKPNQPQVDNSNNITPHTCSYSAWEYYSQGQHQRFCTSCYETENSNHTWDSGKVSKQATCAAEGEKIYTCTTCGGTKSEVIAKLAHNFTEKIESNKYLKAKATYTSGAQYYYSCVCGQAGTKSFSLNNRIEWITTDMLQSDFNLSAGWVGGVTDGELRLWTYMTDIGEQGDSYLIYNQMRNGMGDSVYNGSYNGVTVRFYIIKNPSHYAFYYDDLVTAGII